MNEETTASEHRQFSCSQCGAKLEYKPGAGSLVCPYCGFENDLPEVPEEVEEIDFHATLAALENSEVMDEVQTVACAACGAVMQRAASVASEECSFCGSAIVTAGGSTRLIKPKAMLPFKVEREEGRREFKKWVKSRWFAPGGFKKRAKLETKLEGVYIPYWTFDCNTTTQYTGQRGEYYYVTTGSGKNRHTTRHTRWYPAQGVVNNTFDDLMVYASRSLPTKYIEKLEPWDLDNLVSYQDEYLSGFRAESYQIGLEDGFSDAKVKMDVPIRQTVRKDIGGDTQRINTMSISYDDITFKHLLLPLWISTYRYKDKPYRVMVNARTGEVQGERPWSAIKITLAVLAALIVIIAIISLFASNTG